MSGKDDKAPDPKDYSPAEKANGLFRKDREAWEASRRERGLPDRPEPKASDYSPAERANGLYRKDREEYDGAMKKGKKA